MIKFILSLLVAFVCVHTLEPNNGIHITWSNIPLGMRNKKLEFDASLTHVHFRVVGDNLQLVETGDLFTFLENGRMVIDSSLKPTRGFSQFGKELRYNGEVLLVCGFEPVIWRTSNCPVIPPKKTQNELAREEKDRLEREEKDRLVREEKDRLAREEKDRIAREKDRLEREEQDRIEKEEKDRIAREEKVRLEKEEKDRIAMEEKDRLEKEEKDRVEKEEKDRIAREEKDRLEKEEKDRVEKEEKERFAREEKVRLAKEEKDRIEKEEQDCISEEERDRTEREDKVRIAEAEKDYAANEAKDRAEMMENDRIANKEEDQYNIEDWLQHSIDPIEGPVFKSKVNRPRLFKYITLSSSTMTSDTVSSSAAPRGPPAPTGHQA